MTNQMYASARKHKRGIRKLSAILVSLCLILLYGAIAQAAEPPQGTTAAPAQEEDAPAQEEDAPAQEEDAPARPQKEILPDPARPGSLTIQFTDPSTGEPDKFGNKVGLYKVADFQTEEGCKLVYDELFESVGDPPARDAQLNADLARQLNETAEIKGISLDAPSEEIWSNGGVTFKDLDAGLYLVVQTHRVSDSEKSVIEPFLALIPSRGSDGALNYDVKISSPGSSTRKSGSEDQLSHLANVKEGDKLPRVGGADVSAGLAIILFAAGTALVICGAVQRVKSAPTG